MASQGQCSNPIGIPDATGAGASTDASRGLDRLPRVLFISVNPFSSTSNNGRTFASFFKGYPSPSIAQLYFHRELPSGTVCNQYYRITDEHLLKGLIRPRRITGERVGAMSTSNTSIPERTHSALKRSKGARLLRQLLWARIPLDNPELAAWLDQFQPQVVFFCGGDAASLYPKVSALVSHYRAKLVFYITDDYVLPTHFSNVFAFLMRWWTRYAFRRITAVADLVLTIGESMTTTYKREFGVNSIPIMNLVTVPPVQPALRTPSKRDDPFTLLYAGSLHSNRWRVLTRIAESIQRLSARGISIRLQIFGPDPTAEASEAFRRLPYVEHGGLLSPEELGAAIAQADTLVHVEADDPESMAATALSISTKIPEYLASGRSILAIGPKGLASIDYLSAHHAAIVLEPSDVAGLDEALTTLALDPGLSHDLARRAFNLARTNHDGTRARRALWRRLAELSG